MAISETKMLHN